MYFDPNAHDPRTTKPGDTYIGEEIYLTDANGNRIGYGNDQGGISTNVNLQEVTVTGRNKKTANADFYSGSFLTGVANFQSEFAKIALKTQARTSSYNMFTKSFSFSKAKGFLKASKLSEKVAKKFGVASALFILAEGWSDGNLSRGDVTKQL